MKKGTTNPELKKTIIKLKKTKKPVFVRIAQLLEKPRRKRIEVNLWKINKNAKEGELIVVPGKILAYGDLTKKIKISSFNASKKAIEKINKVGEYIKIEDLDKQKEKIRIMGWNKMIIIDAEKNILGRMASKAAKELLKGEEEVVIVNAEKAIITGSPEKTVEKYKGRMKLRDPANPKRSRKNSRRPDLFVKRIIRGMIPYKSRNGTQAYRRLKVYMNVPKEYEGKAEKISESKSITSDYKYIEVGKLCKRLGWKG